MYYGTNELAQLVDGKKIINRDLIEYRRLSGKDLKKPSKSALLACYYNNVYAISTHLFRLQSSKIPKDSGGHTIDKPIDTKVSRSLVGVRLSDMFPGYADSERIRNWWLDNFETLDSDKLPSVAPGGHLERVIGRFCRAFTSTLSVICDCPVNEDDLDFLFTVQRHLGIKEDAEFYTNFKLVIPFDCLDTDSLKAKAVILMSVKKHLRRRIYLLPMEGSLKDCIRLAEVTGCRVAVHVEELVEEGIPINLKHKMIDALANTTRDNQGSSANMLILTTEKKTSRLEKMVPYYAKNFGPVLIWRGAL